MRRRISYFDVVGKATAGLDERQVGRAIARLSATYRAGRSDFDYASELVRAAYLWHLLPAHVCDLARLFGDTGVLEGRARVRLVGLGAGPGSEVLAALEEVSAARCRGELADLTHLEAVRIDRARDWDASFASLLPPLREQLIARGCGFEESWSLEATPRSIVWDVVRDPPPEAALEAAAGADVLVAANLLTELPPRGTDELPGAAREGLTALLERLAAGADVLVLDRAGAPGAAARTDALASAAADLGFARVGGRDQRATRCGCALTRQGKAIYRHVRLPTTRDADRPVKNCKTRWVHLRRSETT